MVTNLRTIPKIFITPMRVEDIPAVMQVELDCFATPWSENAYRTELTNHLAQYFTAWMNGELVGYGGLWLIMDEVHITTLGVSDKCRGMKIGERLLIRIIDASRESGAERITLEVRKSNQIARQLYNKYGFLEAAIRKGYYSDNNEDAVIMWVYDLWSAEFLSRLDSHKAQLLAMEEQEP